MVGGRLTAHSEEEMVFSSSPVEPLSERKTIVVRQENTLRRDVSRGQKHLTIASLRPRDITYISCILLPQTLDLKVISLSRGLWRRILSYLFPNLGHHYFKEN